MSRLHSRASLHERWLGQRVYVVAEIGVNHDGKLGQAIDLLHAAVDAGADAVKFQTFQAPALLPRAHAAFSSLEGLELPRDAWAKLKALADARRVDFLSTPFDVPSLELLRDLGVEALKIPSGEITNPWLIEAAARQNVPLILSTGASTLSDIDQALSWIRRYRHQPQPADLSVVLLHCVSAYPAPAAQTHLRVIPALRERYALPVGFSDHSEGDALSLASVALGACLIERHLTLNRSLAGADHAMSMLPEEFARMVRQIREIEAGLGHADKAVQAAELPSQELIRRGLYTRRALRAGTTLSDDDVVALRPERGALSSAARDQIVGRVICCDLDSQVPLTDAHLC